MHRKSVLLTILLMLTLSGCSVPKVQDYTHFEPKFDLLDYFAGETYAWGQFQDRSGKVIRRFQVKIQGTVSNQSGVPTLVLDERFLYDDGERQTRVWTIERLPESHPKFEEGLDALYRGTAEDVIGEAIGKVAGNALNWQYVLNMPYKDSTIHLNFNDWMFLQQDGVLMNRATVTKWGFDVGEVTLFFTKSLPEWAQVPVRAQVPAGSDWPDIK
ncbi:DUF3833 domain-containing protein [Thiomicrorhabdus indica]|uniref:DUF3833 domain-containing protein n=1 Tax=Thiomicrorhabdus indica TaxID=2267253 RepID=UPI002AA85FE8|nr:DUF3833 domain-containing protein [Thiomicrorhabdus indica]